MSTLMMPAAATMTTMTNTAPIAVAQSKQVAPPPPSMQHPPPPTQSAAIQSAQPMNGTANSTTNGVAAMVPTVSAAVAVADPTVAKMGMINNNSKQGRTDH